MSQTLKITVSILLPDGDHFVSAAAIAEAKEPIETCRDALKEIFKGNVDFKSELVTTRAKKGDGVKRGRKPRAAKADANGAGADSAGGESLGEQTGA